MRLSLTAVAFALSITALLPAAQAADTRQRVEMPAPMQEHMLANMRDHLAAMGEIQAALASGKLNDAADIAENRIGMSSLQGHGASHMAPYMPKPMQDIGTAMHRSASRFARTAQEAQVQGGVPRALGALADLTQQCVACHASYRLR
jgi:cytochrome c556